MRNRRIETVSPAVLLFFAWMPAATGATLTVCASNCNQTTVAGALAAAQAGDTMLIGAGTFPAALDIGKNLTIQGAGASQTVLDGQSAGSTVRVEAGATVTASGVTITNSAGTAAAVLSHSSTIGILNLGIVTIADSIVSGNGTGVQNTGGAVTLLRTSITGNDSAGLVTWGDTGTVGILQSAVNTNGQLAGIGGIALIGGRVEIQNSTIGPNKHGQIRNSLRNDLSPPSWPTAA